MSIMDTLITDRTQADADAMNDKGTYKASDLNRVCDAMEYLHNLFKSYGYSMPNYKRIKLQRPGYYETQTITKPILPDGYTQLEYIESTGTQCIDAGLTESTVYGIRMEFYVRSINIDWQSLVSGTLDTGFTAGSAGTEATGLYIRLRGDEVYKSFTSLSSVSVNELVVKDGKINLNGAQVTTYTTGALSSASGKFYVFNNNAKSRYSNMVLYKLELYNNNGDTVRQYVPAKRDYDDAIGLYDIATNAFFSNSGTGTFTAGPENIEYETITEEVFVPDERDPYTWFQDDIPTQSIMDQYLTNLSELRSLFVQAATTPPVPPDMEWFTFQEANDIEKILVDIEDMMRRIEAAYLFSGDLFSGEV